MFSRSSGSNAHAGLREPTWLCPRWAREAGGSLSTCHSSRREPTNAARAIVRISSNPKWAAPADGGQSGWICTGQDRRNSPAPPQLPAPPCPTTCPSPGSSLAACLCSSIRALRDPSPRAGGHRGGDPHSCAGAEAPRNTRVAFGQALARARSGRGWAGFPRILQGLTRSVYYLNSQCLFSTCKIDH